jgi:hypothetical protein
VWIPGSTLRQWSVPDRGREHASYVLHDKESRTRLRNDSHELSKHHAARIRQRRALACGTERLARWPTRDNCNLADAKSCTVKYFCGRDVLDALLDERELWTVPFDGRRREPVALQGNANRETARLEAQVKS